jgi:hypothetical protein
LCAMVSPLETLGNPRRSLFAPHQIG